MSNVFSPQGRREFNLAVEIAELREQVKRLQSKLNELGIDDEIDE
jgi:hypothetical protein